MVRESRIIAELLINKIKKDQWTRAIVDDNLLQKRTPATAKRMAGAIKKRLECLELEFLTTLHEGDDEMATQVALVAAIDRNLLLLEFMETVVKDAYTSNQGQLHHYEWTEFLETCSHKDPKIHQWKESSKKKMGQIVFRILREAGFIKGARVFTLQPVLIRAEIKELLEKTNRRRILESMEIS